MTPDSLTIIRSRADLAFEATAALLAGGTVTIQHPANWVRAGFPLPVQRHQPDPDGITRQVYRPVQVLQWIAERVEAERAEAQKVTTEEAGHAADES